jgi:hypothetical protein
MENRVVRGLGMALILIIKLAHLSYSHKHIFYHTLYKFLSSAICAGILQSNTKALLVNS